MQSIKNISVRNIKTMYIFALIVATGLLSSCAQTENIVTSKLPDDACDCPEQQEDLMSRGLYIKKNGEKTFLHINRNVSLNSMNDTYQHNNSEYVPQISDTLIIDL